MSPPGRANGESREAGSGAGRYIFARAPSSLCTAPSLLLPAKQHCEESSSEGSRLRAGPDSGSGVEPLLDIPNPEPLDPIRQADGWELLVSNQPVHLRSGDAQEHSNLGNRKESVHATLHRTCSGFDGGRVGYRLRPAPAGGPGEEPTHRELPCTLKVSGTVPTAEIPRGPIAHPTVYEGASVQVRPSAP